MSGRKVTRSPEGEATLAWIAELLGCDVALFDGSSGAAVNVAETSELLQLWLAIESRDDRRKLLDFARSLAAT